MNGVFDDTLIQVTDNVLDYAELLEELAACVQYLM